MVLKNLDNFNKEKRRIYEMKRYSNWPKLNGIACPNCGAELYDSDDLILASNPPQKNIHCNKCGFMGYRVI